MAQAEGGSSGRSRIELKMTAMIDVVFLLLIFFLVTLNVPRQETMLESHQQEERPGPGPGPQIETEAEFETINLHLGMENGRVVRKLNNMIVASDDHMLGMLQHFSDVHEDAQMLVSCEDNVPYEHLIRAVSMAQFAEVGVGFAGLN